MTGANVLPEMVRNIRIQLRPRRMLAVALICALGSITAFVYFANSNMPYPWANLLVFLINMAVTVLAAGGGIYCLQSVHREMELNTFDYQRLTRLTPMNLALGKLFGAPSLAYFIVLCLLPVTIAAAVLAGLTIPSLIWVYVVLLLGSLTMHALALSMSALVGRSSSVGAIILFLLVVYILAFAEGNRGGALGLEVISPYFVNEMLALDGIGVRSFRYDLALQSGQDFLFGHPVSHAYVLIVLFLTFTGWFLFGLVRNIKRDPAVYEIYTPFQGFCFVLYLHAIVLAFFQWTRLDVRYSRGAQNRFFNPVAPGQAIFEFLLISVWFFVPFGFALLRNRERVRRRMRHFGAQAAGFWAALWPSPYLFSGFLATGFAMIAMIQHELHPDSGWGLGMSAFEICFLASWIARDGLYLQWMNLRRGRRPLVAAVIYMVAFYACAGALYSAFHLDDPHAFGAYLLPWASFSIDVGEWSRLQGVWIGALIALVVECLVFAALQRRELARLRESSVS